MIKNAHEYDLWYEIFKSLTQTTISVSFYVREYTTQFGNLNIYSRIQLKLNTRREP